MLTLAETKYFLSSTHKDIIISSNSQGSLWKEIEILPDYLSLFQDSVTLMVNFTILTAHWINKQQIFSSEF